MPDVRALLRKVSSRDQSSSFLSRSSSSGSPHKNGRSLRMTSSREQPETNPDPNVNDVVPTRVLIISDTHVAPLEAQDGDEQVPFSEPLPAADVLIHCGDLTHDGAIDQYHMTLDMLSKIDAPVKLVIAGNHDRTLDKDWLKQNPFNLDLTLEERKALWQEATDMWFGKEGRAMKEGVRMLDEGVHTIPLKNGAQLTVYASQYQPEFCRWAFAYELDEDRYNPRMCSLIGAKSIAENPVPAFEERPIDIMMTHGPPYANLDRVVRGDLVGCPHLLRALMRSRPLIHCFGHIHEGWGSERISWGPSVEKVCAKSTTIKEFKKQWGDEIADDGITRLATDMDSAAEKHCIEVDLSSKAKRPIQRGQETLLVNAAIMNVAYEPCNAPWLVQIDLPRLGGNGTK